jgi:hypothetical protein
MNSETACEKHPPPQVLPQLWGACGGSPHPPPAAIGAASVPRLQGPVPVGTPGTVTGSHATRPPSPRGAPLRLHRLW